MLPALATRFAALEGRRHFLLRQLSEMSDEQQRFRVSASSWTPLDVANHLLLVERVAMGVFRDPPVGKWSRRTLANRIRYAMVTAVLLFGIRVRLPLEAITPRNTLPLDVMAAEWEGMRAELRRHLEGITPAQLTQLVFKHPIGGPLAIEDAMTFLVRHFDHHLRQIRRISRAPGFPQRGAADAVVPAAAP